ncbi:hydrogen peroxide-dependent heme synthase [Gephyromycinifex aptenodytis]|uniref:hydrogen peroxide-dependent heme synthase n=1 Tax=Gephyromycinifex aptenodytis TaxID=2716227 RepID=UPI0014457769|nr:hydrogen peroxide-dependent heme synthase [Gephyromycinifex aptenodytis]
MTSPSHASRVRAINESIRYAMWSVFQVSTPLPKDEAQRGELAQELTDFLAALPEQGVEVRGLYDVAGLRADAELMIWWHSERIEQVQSAYRGLRQTRLGAYLRPVWSVAALHRPAEFNKGHIPAFMSGEEARDYVCVYPFVRSFDWYVLPEAERRDMLVEHGQMARPYQEVRANTIASFALNDYEWVLAFESNELHKIVDLMRELRASKARLHVREETPFYTGPRVEPAALIAGLP